MNDSNHTLRFSRTYTEATGRRLSRYDFAPPEPRITARGAFFWTVAIVAICTIIALWR